MYVLIGNYGSGKTELAINFALRAAETGRTEILDLDMVNTYFRLTEPGIMTRMKEIRLVSPNFTNSSGAWYTLDGVKLDKMPTHKGVYIRNGRKVVIK